MRAALLFVAFFSGILAAQTDTDRLLKQAVDEQQRGDLAAAVRDYRKVLASRPGQVEIEVNLGAALAQMGKFDDAIAAYRQALPHLKDKNPVLLNLGLAYYKKADFENARQQFEKLHAAQPDNIQAVILLADCDLRVDKIDSAVSLLEPFEVKHSQNLDFEYVLGSALIKTNGRRREGVARIEKVAEIGRSADSYMFAGKTLLELNEYSQALQDLEQALRLNPDLPGLYTLVGTARDKTGDVAKAEPAFREALRRDPDDFDANLYLGAILYKRHEIEEGRHYLQNALRIRPGDSIARYESAMLDSTAGDYAGAVSKLEQLTRDDPDWLDPHVQLATLYYRLHRPDDGQKERQIVDRLTAEEQAKGPPK